MFAKLDADGGGTLDMGEITALLVENGIHMSVEKVADMFGEAKRMELLNKYRKMVQTGAGDKMCANQLKPKPTSLNILQKLTP